MREENIDKWQAERAALASCAHHHETGRHDKDYCPLPEGYCDEVAELVSRLAE